MPKFNDVLGDTLLRLTAALVPEPTSIVAECRHSGLESYRRYTILALERLRDAVGRC